MMSPMNSRWAVPARSSVVTTLLCVTLALLPMPAASQLADTWKKILATEDEGDIGRQLNKILSKADGESSGRILVQVPGMPEESFVELVTDVFESSVGKFAVGMSIDAIARETCGHVSRTYVRKLAAANTSSIVDGKVAKGKAGAEVDITLPACLNARATVLHRIDKGDSVASISKSVSGREFEAEYCDTLKSLNSFDVCRASQTGRLQVGQQIRIPKSADSQLATPAFAVLKPSKDPTAVARLEQELPKALLTAARAEVGLGMTAPMDGPGVVVVPDAVPTSIVPTTTCTASKPPFDPAALVKAIEQFRVQATKRNIPFASEVVIGVVDTGLHEKSRAMLLKFPPASSSGGAASVMPRQSSLIAGTAEDTFERSFFPTNSPDIAPDAGPFADHGSHVTGLVIGGADLWSYLTTNAFEDARTPEYFASYVPRIVPVKVMSARSGGNPQTGTGEIISAIAYLVQKKAQIVNVSYVARYDVGLDRTFLGLRADAATLIVAAAGNDFESAGSLDDLLEDTRKLPAMMSGDDVPMFITVGALDESGKGKPAPFSQRGAQLRRSFRAGNLRPILWRRCAPQGRRRIFRHLAGRTVGQFRRCYPAAVRRAASSHQGTADGYGRCLGRPCRDLDQRRCAQPAQGAELSRRHRRVPGRADRLSQRHHRPSARRTGNVADVRREHLYQSAAPGPAAQRPADRGPRCRQRILGAEADRKIRVPQLQAQPERALSSEKHRRRGEPRFRPGRGSRNHTPAALARQVGRKPLGSRLPGGERNGSERTAPDFGARAGDLDVTEPLPAVDEVSSPRRKHVA